MPSTLWKFIFGGEERSPAGDLPIKKVDVSHFNRTGGQQLNATWLGHSSVMINLDGYKIMTDPVLQKRVSIVGPSRYNGEVPLDAGALSDIDVIIISHNHYDHLNKYTIQKLKGKTKLFIVPLGVGAQLRKWGVAESKIVELDWWDEYQVHQDLKIAATPTQHFSGRSLSDRDSTLWASFAVIGPKHKVFFSGDSGYFDGFKKIGETYGPFDMTFMECGAYNERWHHIHMYPEETVQAHLDVKGKVLHPIHWGTFNLSLHAWYEPMQRFTKAAAAAGVRTATPIAGDTVVYGQYMGTEKWWAGYMSTQSPMPKKTTRRLEGSIHPLAGQ
ncbi:MAG: hypothetical protein GY765_36540 [bacterium]|nr:hypothetical protein [bacterium]